MTESSQNDRHDWNISRDGSAGLTPWQQRMSFADELAGPLFDLSAVDLDQAFADDGPLAGLPNLWQPDGVSAGSAFHETQGAGSESSADPMPEMAWAHAVWKPENYEAGYAYPLIIWLHSDGNSETQLESVMPRISEQNYLGLALRAPLGSGNEFGWSTSETDVDRLVTQIHESIDAVCEAWHVHPDRIYLAGHGNGGLTALRVLLTRPGFFAGVINLQGDFPTLARPLSRFRELRHKRVLLSLQLGSKADKLADLVASGRMLYNAGMEVGTRIYQPAPQAINPKALREIDHWIMAGVRSAVQA